MLAFDWEWPRPGPGSPNSRLDKAGTQTLLAWATCVGHAQSSSESPLLHVAGSQAGPQPLCSRLLLQVRTPTLYVLPDSRFVQMDSPAAMRSVAFSSLPPGSRSRPTEQEALCPQFKRLVSSWMGRECRKKVQSENTDKLGKSPAPSLLERLPLKPHIHNLTWNKNRKQQQQKWKVQQSLYETLKKAAADAAAKSLQSCPTLCNPIDGSPPGFPIPGILQARTVEWVAISFSNAWKWKVKVKSLSRVRLLATPWTAAHPAPPSMGFSRQEYWSGLPLEVLMKESE